MKSLESITGPGRAVVVVVVISLVVVVVVGSLVVVVVVLTLSVVVVVTAGVVVVVLVVVICITGRDNRCSASLQSTGYVFRQLPSPVNTQIVDRSEEVQKSE